jgi:hypothetical protein
MEGFTALLFSAGFMVPFLEEFAKLRKVTTRFIISFYMSVRHSSLCLSLCLYVRLSVRLSICMSVCLSFCLTVRLEQLDSHWSDFYEDWYLSIFRKSAEKIQVSLKLDNKSSHFT